MLAIPLDDQSVVCDRVDGGGGLADVVFGLKIGVRRLRDLSEI